MLSNRGRAAQLEIVRVSPIRQGRLRRRRRDELRSSLTARPAPKDPAAIGRPGQMRRPHRYQGHLAFGFDRCELFGAGLAAYHAAWVRRGHRAGRDRPERALHDRNWRSGPLSVPHRQRPDIGPPSRLAAGRLQGRRAWRRSRRCHGSAWSHPFGWPRVHHSASASVL